MNRTALLISLITFIINQAAMAQDSVLVQAHPSYNKVSGVHRMLFGENYRKEWAADTKVPVIHLSAIKGGLTATERGGGHQTHSLRLVDRNGAEWVLRTIEKFPQILIPERLRETFAKDWIDDSMSAQHPYAALIVPVLAEATGVAHTNPIIGVVAPDSALKEFAPVFENKLCLLEEREPLGKSDNTPEMFENISADNDNRVDAQAFLKATLLDVVIGDWDRHVDQWRWKDEQDGSGKRYLAIPRDRDCVFFVNQGLFPYVASRPWLLPFLQGFDYEVENINTYLWESRIMANRILNQLSYEEWMNITREFASKLTDAKLEEALRKLPQASYKLRHTELFNKMQAQRDNLEKEMNTYYRFLNKIVEIQLTDKNERVMLQDTAGKLAVDIRKISKNGRIEDVLFSRIINPEITKEVRIYAAKGDDSVIINTKNQAVKVRLIGGDGKKTYIVNDVQSRVLVYDKTTTASFTGSSSRINKRLSDDSLNTAIIPINRYNINKQLFTAGYNNDDGVLVGIGLRHTHQGFRKTPYASVQQITAAHSFSTEAFRISYAAEWIRAVFNADLLVKADYYGPNNTMNFFGRGNETAYIKSGNYRTFYRTRFDLAQVDPALRWRLKQDISLTAGLSFQYYHLNAADNTGRFITSRSVLNSYDSTSVNNQKVHAGLVFGLMKDKRDEQLLPAAGSYLQVKVQAYEGLNSYSRSFVQIMPELRLYKRLTKDSSLVLAERLGGGLTAGKTTFYQSMFLGGHDNLLGYRQYRFAGQHMIFNNLELRLRIARLATYLLPGELGLTGFYDTGRVWEKNETSNKWHHGVGGGAYFAPARYAVIQFTEGYSEEGWFPYLKLSMRF